MDTAQPVATTMTTEPAQQTSAQKQDDEQVMRLRGGGACTDCLA
jgi:hypothetical protein